MIKREQIKAYVLSVTPNFDPIWAMIRYDIDEHRFASYLRERGKFPKFGLISELLFAIKLDVDIWRKEVEYILNTIEVTLEVRKQLKKQKRYAEADKLRKELEDRFKLTIKDNKDGTYTWRGQHAYEEGTYE